MTFRVLQQIWQTY